MNRKKGVKKSEAGKNEVDVSVNSSSIKRPVRNCSDLPAGGRIRRGDKLVSGRDYAPCFFLQIFPASPTVTLGPVLFIERDQVWHTNFILSGNDSCADIRSCLLQYRSTGCALYRAFVYIGNLKKSLLYSDFETGEIIGVTNEITGFTPSRVSMVRTKTSKG